MRSRRRKWEYDVSDGYTGNGTGGGKGTGGPAAKDDPKLILGITDRTCDFIETQAKSGHPFFVQVSHYAVHLDIFYRAETLEQTLRQSKGKKHTMPEFAAMTSDVDTGIGTLIDKINSLGLRDNTYIFFMSDNGGRLTMPGQKGQELPRNRPLREGKGTMYQGGFCPRFRAWEEKRCRGCPSVLLRCSPRRCCSPGLRAVSYKENRSMSSLPREIWLIAMSALGCLFVLPASVPAQGAESIETERLSVVVDVDSQRFAVADKALDRAFIKRGTFTRPFQSVQVGSIADPIWGQGHELTIAHTDGWMTLIRLYGKHPFVHIHTVASNRTKEPVTISKLKLLEFEYDLDLPCENVRTLGTGGLRGAQAAGSYTFAAVVDPETRRGIVSGWLTHERGVGVFFPKEANGRTFVATQIDFGQFRIEPGKTRPIDTMVVGYFDDARLGLEAYADAVARQYTIKLAPQPSVYCTWYHARASNQQRIAENTRYAAKHLKPFGLNVMQIDDKWQAILPKGFRHEGKIKTTGPIKVFVDSNESYPDGMAHTAKAITSHGMVSGIWFMPFAGNYRNPYFDHDIFAKNPHGTPFHDARWSGTCLDLSHPKAQAFVAERVKRIYDWGYRYFKLDGMHTGAPSHNIYVNKEYRSDTFPDSRLHDPNATHVEAYRKGLQIVRENAPDAFVLGCNVSQNMISMGPAFGLVDAMRIGPDNGSAGRGNFGGVKVGAWHGSTLYFLNGRVWHNDPDPVYVREGNPLHMAQLMCSWVAVTGSMLTTSYQFFELPEERLDLLKRTMPGHGLLGRPADLFETDQPRIWLLTDTRRNVRRDVIGLFNWSENEPVDISYDIGRLGLDPNSTYCAFDFWENKFVDPIRATLRQTLPGGSCRVLAVRPVADHPQLLSTSRHIAQCMVDVLHEHWDMSTKTLSGKSEVVAGDAYEMRIALPASRSWKVKNATAGELPLTLDESSAAGVRLRFTARASGTVHWSVHF